MFTRFNLQHQRTKPSSIDEPNYLAFFLFLQRLFWRRKGISVRGINKQNPPSSSYQWMFWRGVVEVDRSIVVRSFHFECSAFTLWINSSTWLLNVRKIFALKIIFLLQSTLHHLMHYVPNLLFYWFVIQRLIRCKISNIPTTTRQPGIYCSNR